MTEYPGREVVLAGHSAGAHLAGLLAINHSRGDGSLVKGFICLAGPYYFYPFSESMHWRYFGPAWQYPSSQPVWQLHQDMPSMLLLHGANDHRVSGANQKPCMSECWVSEAWLFDGSMRILGMQS